MEASTASTHPASPSSHDNMERVDGGMEAWRRGGVEAWRRGGMQACSAPPTRNTYTMSLSVHAGARHVHRVSGA